jgi:hypothetical protein
VRKLYLLPLEDLLGTVGGKLLRMWKYYLDDKKKGRKIILRRIVAISRKLAKSRFVITQWSYEFALKKRSQ